MAEFLRSAVRERDFPETEKEIIFLGRSNVGKSSLINALYGKKTAYVGKTPGKTKMLNFFDAGDHVFVDAPGYGYARRSEAEIIAFGDMMEAYFSKRSSLRLAVKIIDVRHAPTKDDRDMLEYLRERKIPCLTVANKTDKLSGNGLAKQKKLLEETLSLGKDEILYVSAETKKGIPELREKIGTFLV